MATRAIDFIARKSFVPALAPTRPKKGARQSSQRARIGPSMDAFMLRPTHDSRKLEPTIATIRPLRNSARQAGVTRTPRISALSPPRSLLRYHHASCAVSNRKSTIQAA